TNAVPRQGGLGTLQGVICQSLRWLPVLIVVGLVSTSRAQQPAPQNENKEKPAYKLTLKSDPVLPSGQAALVKGDSNPEGDQFFLENVGVLQPVAITLIAQNDGDEIKLVLAKQRWDESLRESSTGTRGPRGEPLHYSLQRANPL